MELSKTGKTIAKLRRSAGFTQASLAEKLGISDKAVSKWERGIACPDVSLWDKLSILLDTDIESLIYGDEEKSEWRGLLILDESVPLSTIVYNKPLIHYLISQFLLVGIRDIIIFGARDSFELPGVKISFLTKTLELNQRFTTPVFVIFGNSFLYGPNLTKHFKRAMSRTEGITVISSMKRKGKYPIFVDENRKVALAEELLPNQYYAEPFVFFSINSGYTKYISHEDILKDNNLNTETMERGMMSFQISTFDDLFQLAEFVRLMEKQTNERIGCVEEILIRRGIVEYEDVKKLCDKETGRYLEELFTVNRSM